MNKLVTIQDFKPVNKWTLDNQGPTWMDSDDFDPEYIIDQSTGNRYWNESKGTIRFKCVLLSLGTPLLQPLISSVAGVGLSALKILSLSHFWAPNDITSSLSERLVDMSLDLLKILLWPIVLLGLEISALYGIFNPYDGRKLYASIERAYYGGPVIAPCFQPDPTRHAFHGDPRKRNAF